MMYTSETEMCCQGNKDAVRSSAAVAELMMSTAECDLLVTHIESLCYFWAQIADQDTAQRMATLTVNMVQAQLPVITGRLQPGTVCLSLSLSLSVSFCMCLSVCVCYHTVTSNIWNSKGQKQLIMLCSTSPGNQLPLNDSMTSFLWVLLFHVWYHH